MQLFWRSSIYLVAAWLLAAARPAAARTEVWEFVSSSDTSTELHTNDALATRLDFATTPELNISLAGGWSAADQSAWDLQRQLFLRGDARMELAEGRWIQTLYAGYTDQRHEKRTRVDAGRLDVAKLQGTSRFTLGALQEIRLSPKYSFSFGLQALHETLDARERIRLGLGSDSALDTSWSHTERRTQRALIENRMQIGRGRLELGGAFEAQAGTGRLLARAAGDYVTRSGIQVLASVGIGLADPSRLTTSLAAAAASGAPLGPLANTQRALPHAWHLKASRRFAAGKVTLGANVSQARAQGPLDRLGDLSGHLELSSSDPDLHARAQRFESFVAFSPLAALRFELAYLVTSARLHAGGPYQDLAVSRQAARANLTWTPLPSSSVGLSFRSIGRREGDASSTLTARVGATQGSYSACDVSLRHAFGTRWRMVAQLESIVHRSREPGSAAPPPRVRGTLGFEGTF